MLCAILVFQLVTLPVEFNASNKAKKQIQELVIDDMGNEDEVCSVLFVTSMTYVASVVNTLLQLLRMLLIISSSRNERN